MNFIKNTFFFLFLCVTLISCNQSDANSTKSEEILNSISDKMQEQENCWNVGDLECFMQHYWHSDSLLFIGKSGLTYGWQKTLDNYIGSYPDKSAMGKLTFKNEIVKFMDKETVQVIGEWKLERDKLENLGGYYSLIWKLKDDDWVIVSDHSS